jgi:two-component system OmpR family response regulator
MTRTRKLITILDDTREIREMLAHALEDAGFETKSYDRAADFERDLRSISPDLCIIDLGLPDKDGLGIVNRISSGTDAAVVIISGRASTSDKIVGLELGADDYITKPFEIAEVVARVKALLRRTVQSQAAPAQGSVFQFSGWTVDLDQHHIIPDGGEASRLSFAEGQLLRIFLDSPNRLITRDHILDQLSDGQSDNYDRAIDVRVSRLRSKLHDDPNNPKIIKTIYGAGYIFIADIVVS